MVSLPDCLLISSAFAKNDILIVVGAKVSSRIISLVNLQGFVKR